jgi:hypothetical protein
MYASSIMDNFLLHKCYRETKGRTDYFNICPTYTSAAGHCDIAGVLGTLFKYWLTILGFSQTRAQRRPIPFTQGFFFDFPFIVDT